MNKEKVRKLRGLRRFLAGLKNEYCETVTQINSAIAERRKRRGIAARYIKRHQRRFA